MRTDEAVEGTDDACYKYYQNDSVKLGKALQMKVNQYFLTLSEQTPEPVEWKQRRHL